MNRPKYVFKSLGGNDSDNSIDDYIFFCEPHISGRNNEGYITRHCASIRKINGNGMASLANLGNEKLFRKDKVEIFNFKRYIRTNMSLMATGRIYNKNKFRHELNKVIK